MNATQYSGSGFGTLLGERITTPSQVKVGDILLADTGSARNVVRVTQTVSEQDRFYGLLVNPADTDYARPFGNGTFCVSAAELETGKYNKVRYPSSWAAVKPRKA